MKKIGLFIIVFVFASLSMSAIATEINTPEPFDNYVEKYKYRFAEIQAKYSGSTRPITEILRDFAKDIGRLEEEFRQERREDYETYRHQIQKNQSCTNGTAGKRKVCGGPTITCPADTFLVENESGVRGGGTYLKGKTNKSLSWEVVKTGKGRNEGTATVHCAYEDKYVSVKIEDELKRIKKLAGVE